MCDNDANVSSNLVCVSAPDPEETVANGIHNIAVCKQKVICYNRRTMTHPTPIDISKFPDLLRIAEEVQTTKTAHILKRDSEPIALLTPVKTATKPRKRREKTKADYEAFRPAAGGWKEVDTDSLLRNIYATRKLSNQPTIKL
jgi:hypothetical protein